VPGTGKACMSCSAKKVRCSLLGAKSAEIVVSSDEEVETPRPKKPKASGIVPKAGKVSVEVGKTAEASAEILDAIRHQNALLSELLVYQQQSSIGTALLSEWARPMVNYVARIAHALEARNEAGGSGGSGPEGSGSGDKEKGKEKERDVFAENGSGNGDEDGDGDEEEDGDGDSERDADGDETMGKSM
jgi:hypothetical protein